MGNCNVDSGTWTEIGKDSKKWKKPGKALGESEYDSSCWNEPDDVAGTLRILMALLYQHELRRPAMANNYVEHIEVEAFCDLHWGLQTNVHRKACLLYVQALQKILEEGLFSHGTPGILYLMLVVVAYCLASLKGSGLELQRITRAWSFMGKTC